MAIEATKTRSLITCTMKLDTFTDKITCWGCLQLLEFLLQMRRALSALYTIIWWGQYIVLNTTLFERQTAYLCDKS